MKGEFKSMVIVKYIGENPWHCTPSKEIVVEVPAEQDGKVLTDDQVEEIKSITNIKLCMLLSQHVMRTKSISKEDIHELEKQAAEYGDLMIKEILEGE